MAAALDSMATLAPFAAGQDLFAGGVAPQGNHDEDWEGLVQEYMHDIHYTTMLEAAVNFVHAMIGPAVVALPFAVSQVRRRRLGRSAGIFVCGLWVVLGVLE